SPRAAAASSPWLAPIRSTARAHASGPSSATGGQSCSGVGSTCSPPSRRNTISAHAVMCRTISQMLCAPAIGRAAARPRGTPSSRSVSAGPCHIGPVTVRSIRVAIVAAWLINHLLLTVVYCVMRESNHREHGDHRDLLFLVQMVLCSLCSLWLLSPLSPC